MKLNLFNWDINGAILYADTVEEQLKQAIEKHTRTKNLVEQADPVKK